jgi:uncharacterized membrane protein
MGEREERSERAKGGSFNGGFNGEVVGSLISLLSFSFNFVFRRRVSLLAHEYAPLRIRIPRVPFLFFLIKQTPLAV